MNMVFVLEYTSLQAFAILCFYGWQSMDENAWPAPLMLGTFGFTLQILAIRVIGSLTIGLGVPAVACVAYNVPKWMWDESNTVRLLKCRWYTWRTGKPTYHILIRKNAHNEFCSNKDADDVAHGVKWLKWEKGTPTSHTHYSLKEAMRMQKALKALGFQVEIS